MILVLIVIAVLLILLSGSELSTLKTVTADTKNLTLSSKLFSGATKTLSGGIKGLKKGLLFGLNYTGQSSQLYGCITDVQNLQSFLVSKNFAVSIFTDNTTIKPTSSNIISKTTEFVNSLGSNDCGFIWFSGHGTLVKGRNAWVPIDYSTSGFLVEDRIRSIVSKSKGRLFIGSDSCHSGSLLDLKFDLEPRSSTKSARVISRNVALGDALTTADSAAVPETKNINRLVPTETPEPFDESIVEQERALSSAVSYSLFDIKNFSSLSCDIVYLSGCRDNQTSADAFIAGQSQGAMTWAFLKSIKSMRSNESIGFLQDLTRLSLKNRYTQVPQMSCGGPINGSTSISQFGF
jgi:hypothetical protein